MSSLISLSTSTVLSKIDRYAVTSMCISKRFIVVGLDNESVGIFDQEGILGLRWMIVEYVIWSLDVREEEDGQKAWLIYGGGQGLLQVGELDTLKDISTLNGHTDTIRCVKAVASDRAVSSSRDFTIRVWNIITGECQAILEGHTGTVRTLAYNKNILVSASYDSTARIWSLENQEPINQECIHVLRGHKGQIYSAVCDEKKVVTAGLGGEVMVWEIMTGACLAVLVVPAKVVTCLELLSTVLVTGDTEGALHLWSMDDYTRLRKLQAPGHRNSIISMQASGSKIVSGSSDGIKEWDLDSGELVRQLADSSVVWQVRYTRGTIAAAFVQDGNLILKIW